MLRLWPIRANRLQIGPYENLMKARTILGGASYGPDRLKDIYQAFDEAWAAIRPLVDDAPLAQEAARVKLANLILGVAKDENSSAHKVT